MSKNRVIKPRLVEVTFTFQLVGPSNETHLFSIRAARFGAEIKLRFDIQGDKGPIENLPPELLEAIRIGLEVATAQAMNKEIVELEA